MLKAVAKWQRQQQNSGWSIDVYPFNFIVIIDIINLIYKSWSDDLIMTWKTADVPHPPLGWTKPSFGTFLIPQPPRDTCNMDRFDRRQRRRDRPHFQRS